MSNLSSMGAGQPSNVKLAVGDEAPDFVLPDHSGRPLHFADVRGEGAIVLFFYPRDYSLGCTVEVCAFRDSYEAFKDAGATVIGISADSTESHEGFVERYQLPFILLSDTDGVVRKQYGVEKTFGILSARATYVIDRQGVVRHIFSSQINIDKHVEDALRVILSLQSEADESNLRPARPGPVTR